MKEFGEVGQLPRAIEEGLFSFLFFFLSFFFKLQEI